jgi:hypothetical protein
MDIRDKFNYTIYGSEKNANGDAYAEISRDNAASVIIETQGSELSIEAANCKLTGDLTYEVNNTKTQTTEGEDDDANEVYTFKSHVESATEVKSSFDIGPRIEVKSFVASYDTPKNGHYIIFNNERIYLEENKTEYQTYNARYLASLASSTGYTSYEIKKHEQQQEQSGDIKTKTKTFALTRNNAASTCIYNGTTSDETISGYVLSVHTALTQEAYDELMGNVKSDYNGVKFSNNLDNTIQDAYYYEGDYLQDYLNKHGMPIYTNHFKSGDTAMDHCMIYGYNLNDLKVVGIGKWEEKGNNGFQEGNQTVGDNGVNTNKTAQQKFNYNTTYFGSYIYESSDKFFVKNEYAAFKITGDGVSNIDDIYVFYNYRDAQLDYEPRAMFYEIKENNEQRISIPTKITIKYNGNDVEYSMQKTITCSAVGVMRTIFSGDTWLNSLQSVYDEPLSDGVEVYFEQIRGTAEYNDLNDTWYFKCGNEYFPMYFIILYYDYDDKDYYLISNFKGDGLDAYRGDFNFLSDGTVAITYDKKIYKVDLPQSIDNIPQVKDEDGNYYCWVKIQETYKISGDTATIGGIKYKVYKALLNEYNPKRVEDFICKVMPDQYNTDYDSIESNPPKLLCSVIKSYGFNETTVKQGALRSNYLQLSSWVSSNSAIVNSDNHNLVNGVFLITKSQAIVNNKLYNTRRLMPKCDGDEYVLDRSGNRITMKIRVTDTDDYKIRFWDIALLHSIKNGETEFNDIKLVSGETAQEEATEITNKKITWVDISHSKYEYIFNLRNGPLSGTTIDVPPHYSIMDMGEFDCWDIKLQKYGEKYYFQGQTKIRNILNENIKYGSSRAYSNCNAKGSLPSVNSGTTNIINTWYNYNPTNPNEFPPNEYLWLSKDKLDISNYFTESPVIGEIYTYIDLHAFGDIDQNGLFAFNDNSANEVFPGTGTIGRQYGHYEPLMVQHQNLQEVVSFRGIDGESMGGIDAKSYNEQERDNIGIYKSRFYKDLTQLSSYESIYESNELYDTFVFVYQPNVNNEILKGTQMLSCLLCNNYSNTNDDYRFRNTLVRNQSTSFSVAPVYVGEKVIDTVSGKVLVPIYLLNGMNEEIKKGLIESNLSYYVNGKEWIYQGADDEYRNKMIHRSAKFYLTSDNNVAIISTKTLLINKYLEDSNLSCKIVDGDKKDMYFMNYNGLFEESIDNKNMTKLRIKKINPNEDAIKYYLRFVPTYYHEIGIDNNINNDITITGDLVTSENPLVGRPIYVALDAPLSSFTQYSYSASSGDGSTFINKNGISSSLAFTSSDSTTKIDNLYKSNCTCGEFFAEVIKMRNSKMMEGLPTTLDEWNTILEELKGESNKFMFTSKFKKDLFVMIGQEYFAYTNSDGKNVVKPLFFQETALQYTGDKAFVDIQVNVGQTHTIIATRGMSVEFSDNNVQVVSGLNYSNYVIELIDPYSDVVLQTYQFNGFEANENHLRLRKGDVDKEYVYGESTANRNDSILEEVNSVLASLKENDYITIWDYRTRSYYPSSYVEDLLDGQVSCKTNIKNDENEVFVCKHDRSKYNNNNNRENMIVYDRQNIFNLTSRGHGVEFYDFSSGENSERTIYNKNSDTVFIKYGKCSIDSEYIYQIICDDGYSVVGRSSEILTTVNSNGNKETFTYDEIVTKSILGLSLYHLSEVDGVYYEFVSKISRVIRLSNNDVHVLTYNINLKNTNPTYMNLKVNNLIYKLQID